MNKMGNIGTTATIVLIIILFLGGISVISTDINKNPNLDNKSKVLLADLRIEYNNSYNANSAFLTNEDNFNINATFQGVDAYSRQYLENKVEITQKKSTTNIILGLPGLFLKMFGVENETLLILWNTAIYSFIAFMLGLQIYKAIRTGEVD